MAKSQTATFGTGAMGAMPGFAAVARANQATLNAVAHIGVQSMRQMVDMTQQYLDFIRHRLDEDTKTAERIGKCNSMPEIVDAVTDFYQTAYEEYSKEMNDLSEMAARAASDTLEESEKAARQSA